MSTKDEVLPGASDFIIIYGMLDGIGGSSNRLSAPTLGNRNFDFSSKDIRQTSVQIWLFNAMPNNSVTFRWIVVLYQSFR